MEILKRWRDKNLTPAAREDINSIVQVVLLCVVVAQAVPISLGLVNLYGVMFEAYSHRTEVETPTMKDCRWEMSLVPEPNRLVLACRPVN